MKMWTKKEWIEAKRSMMMSPNLTWSISRQLKITKWLLVKTRRNCIWRQAMYFLPPQWCHSSPIVDHLRWEVLLFSLKFFYCSRCRVEVDGVCESLLLNGCRLWNEDKFWRLEIENCVGKKNPRRILVKSRGSLETLLVKGESVVDWRLLLVNDDGGHWRSQAAYSRLMRLSLNRPRKTLQTSRENSKQTFHDYFNENKSI